jgi:regulator of nucleoside diphosphate kinase
MPTDIFITEIDKARLKKTIQNHSRSLNKDKTIGQLIEEIDRAVIVEPAQVPFNVVTMNSRIRLHVDYEELEISLVYPDQADWTNNKLSILSPIGTAILGYKEGDRISWEVPSGITEIVIKEVLYQPEAAGDYHL